MVIRKSSIGVIFKETFVFIDLSSSTSSQFLTHLIIIQLEEIKKYNLKISVVFCSVC